MSASDFLINGVPYAKVLYMEGNVWIRPPGDVKFHLLAADEPMPLHSIVYTGATGILDFATGPGMATRMVPQTLIRIAELPDAPASSTSTSGTSQVSRLGLRNGTLFSALGRSDDQPVDYEVRTPQGVAGARGTMFATTVTNGQSEVNMLHGTVNFETPDKQTSQITAGQSQQISGTAGGSYHFSQHKTLSPSNSTEFFNHAGGLLEHASGSGVVRRSLGPDVAKTLQKQGYKLPAETQKRFQNAATTHYSNQSATHNANKSKPDRADETPNSAKTPESHPSTTTTDRHPTSSGDHSNPTKERKTARHGTSGEKGLDGKNKNLGQ